MAGHTIQIGGVTAEKLETKFFRSGQDVIATTLAPSQTSLQGFTEVGADEARKFLETVQGLNPQARTSLEKALADPFGSGNVNVTGGAELLKDFKLDTSFLQLSAIEKIIAGQGGLTPEQFKAQNISPFEQFVAQRPGQDIETVKQQFAQQQQPIQPQTLGAGGITQPDLPEATATFQKIQQQLQALLQTVQTEGVTGAGGEQIIAPQTQQQVPGGGFTGGAITPPPVPAPAPALTPTPALPGTPQPPTPAIPSPTPPPTPTPGTPQPTPTGVPGTPGAVPGQQDQRLNDLQTQIQAIQDTLVSGLNPTEKEQQLQQQLDNILAGGQLGQQQVSEQPIATGFITGQQAAIERRAGVQALPLEQQLGRLQAQRQGALDVGVTKLGFAENRLDDLREDITEQRKLATTTAEEKEEAALVTDTVKAVMENPQLFNQLSPSQKTTLIPQLRKAGFTFPEQEVSTKFTTTQTNKLEQAGLTDSPRDEQLDFLFGQTPEEQDKQDAENLIRQVSVGGGTIENAKQVLRGGGFDPANFKKELENIYGETQVRELTFREAREDLQTFRTRDISPNTIFTQIQQAYGQDLTISELTSLMNEAGYFKIAGQWIQQF